MAPQAWNFLEVPAATSTNDLAKEVPLWTAIRAEVQTSGRGQRGRTWHSQKGGFWASYRIPSITHPAPSIVIGAALVIELRKIWKLPQLRLKFPNDLYLGTQKLGGILIEKNSSTDMIVGIGLNVTNPLPPATELRNPASSLARVMSRPPGLHQIQKDIAEILEFAVFTPSIDLHQAWSQDPIEVRIETHGAEHTGIFLGVSQDGSPILKNANGDLIEIPAYQVLQFAEQHSGEQTSQDPSDVSV